eukprot:2236302-Prymnesium_polylepis.1
MRATGRDVARSRRSSEAASGCRSEAASGCRSEAAPGKRSDARIFVIPVKFVKRNGLWSREVLVTSPTVFVADGRCCRQRRYR